MKKTTQNSRKYRMNKMQAFKGGTKNNVFQMLVPKNKNDLKRWGVELFLHHGEESVRLNGNDLRSLKATLNKAEKFMNEKVKV